MDSSLASCLDTLAGVCQHHGKPYCYPSQKTILGLLKKYQNVSISLRTLNRWLADLEGCGYFKRVKRHIRGKDGEMVFRSTLYKLTGKTFNLMASLGKRVKRFFSVFRVPKMAQYPDTSKQVSGTSPALAVDNPVDKVPKGGPSGTSSLISANLERVREFLETLGQKNGR